MRLSTANDGQFHGISSLEKYPDGSIEGCTLLERNEIQTACGVLIPQYEDSSVRRKHIHSVTFYKSGRIKSIALHEQTMVKTSAGVLPAELLTFYESGRLKRVFPLNGKISAYWTEEDEFGLAEELPFAFIFGAFSVRVISVYFYESGAVKGLTLWPNEVVGLRLPAGEAQARIGISLYPDGRLKSFEPALPQPVGTPLGVIEAYHDNAIGINGDNNSLGFYPNGAVKHLATNDFITVSDKKGNKTVFGTKPERSVLLDKMEVRPLWLEFSDDGRFLSIGNDVKSWFNINENQFSISQSLKLVFSSNCRDCSVCEACG